MEIPGLAELREMADQIERGKKHCARMQIYLPSARYWNNEFPRGYAADKDEPSLPCLEALEIPELLTLSQTSGN